MSWGGNQVGLRFEVLPTASLIVFIVSGGAMVLLSDLLRSTRLARHCRQRPTHATTGRVIQEAFAEERPALWPLPLAP
jgi:hypothetical protein